MRYDLAVEQEYNRYQENYGNKQVTALSESMQNLLDAQININAQMLAQASDMYGAHSKMVIDAINKPRTKTVIRDAEGKISGVKEEA